MQAIVKTIKLFFLIIVVGLSHAIVLAILYLT